MLGLRIFYQTITSLVKYLEVSKVIHSAVGLQIILTAQINL